MVQLLFFLKLLLFSVLIASRTADAADYDGGGLGGGNGIGGKGGNFDTPAGYGGNVDGVSSALPSTDYGGAYGAADPTVPESGGPGGVNTQYMKDPDEAINTITYIQHNGVAPQNDRLIPKRIKFDSKGLPLCFVL